MPAVADSLHQDRIWKFPHHIGPVGAAAAPTLVGLEFWSVFLSGTLVKGFIAYLQLLQYGVTRIKVRSEAP